MAERWESAPTGSAPRATAAELEDHSCLQKEIGIGGVGTMVLRIHTTHGLEDVQKCRAQRCIR